MYDSRGVHVPNPAFFMPRTRVKSSTQNTAAVMSTSVSAAPRGQFTRVSNVWPMSSADIGDLPPPSTLGSRNTPTPSRNQHTAGPYAGLAQRQRHFPMRLSLLAPAS